MNLQNGCKFALKTLIKTMQGSTPSPKKIELVCVGFDMQENIRQTTISEQSKIEMLKDLGAYEQEDKQK